MGEKEVEEWKENSLSLTINESQRGADIFGIDLKFTPVRVTESGDYIDNRLELLRSDGSRFKWYSFHVGCGGAIILKKGKDRTKLMICSNCPLRVILPQEIERYGDLRHYFEMLGVLSDKKDA